MAKNEPKSKKPMKKRLSLAIFLCLFLEKSNNFDEFCKTIDIFSDLCYNYFIRSLHNSYYVMAFLFASTPQKPQLLYLLSVYLSTLNSIDSRCVYATVTEYIGKAYYILLLRIVRTGKQVSEIMWINLLLRNICLLAQFFHGSPNIRTIHRQASLGHKDGSFFYALLLGILLQHLAQLLWKKHRSSLPLGLYVGSPFIDSFNGYIF